MYIYEDPTGYVCPHCHGIAVAKDVNRDYVCPDCGWSCEVNSIAATELSHPVYYEVQQGPAPGLQGRARVQSQSQVSRKSWTVALILTILSFFCLGGLQRFYVGKIGTGLLWLCTGGLWFIGTICDLIMLLTHNFKDEYGCVLLP